MVYTVYVNCEVQVCHPEAKSPADATMKACNIINEMLQLHDDHDVNVSFEDGVANWEKEE